MVLRRASAFASSSATTSRGDAPGRGCGRRGRSGHVPGSPVRPEAPCGGDHLGGARQATPRIAWSIGPARRTAPTNRYPACSMALSRSLPCVTSLILSSGARQAGPGQRRPGPIHTPPGPPGGGFPQRGQQYGSRCSVPSPGGSGHGRPLPVRLRAGSHGLPVLRHGDRPSWK